jgi:DNA-directed RNA polymerase II subunit RPB2
MNIMNNIVPPPSPSIKILKKYFEKNNAASIQIESFNDFITHGIKSIIQNQTFTVDKGTKTLVVQIGNVHVPRPFTLNRYNQASPLYPVTARQNALHYDSPCLATIHQDIIDSETNQILESTMYTNVPLFRVPIMVKSEACNLSTTHDRMEECEYDYGGYFIIKGKERVLLAQERINYNQIYVTECKKKYDYVAEIRSIKLDGDYSVMTQVKVLDNILWVKLPYTNQDIPLGIVFRALGVDTTKITDPRLKPSVVQKPEELASKTPQEDALNYIAQYSNYNSITYVKHILEYEMFPHLGLNATAMDHYNFLLIMINKLLATYCTCDNENNCCCPKRPVDDRDHIGNKRMEMVGDLIQNLIKALFKKLLKSLQRHIEQKIDFNINIPNLIQKYSITTKLYTCFATGNWGVVKSNYVRLGVSQVLNRLSYIGTISHLRRIIVPLGKESKNVQVRQIHSTTYGFMCVVDTPEGNPCGLVKNFCTHVKISLYTSPILLYNTVLHLFHDFIQPTKTCRIMLNGQLLGNIDPIDVEPFQERFRYYRCLGAIYFAVSISYDSTDNELIIFCDSGRILRPVWYNQNKSMYSESQLEEMSWETLVNKNIIIYIDGSEAESHHIHPNNVYSEIDPICMFGIGANQIPWANHTQAPRNIYEIAMSKQAISVFNTNFPARFDTSFHILHYPQRRLVSTYMADAMHLSEDMPAGINAVVAVMCYSGYNMEDSVIINKSAIDRGLFCSTSFKTFSTAESHKGFNNNEVIKLLKINRPFHKLNEHGIVRPGTLVEHGDVLVSKYIVSQDPITNENKYKDTSLVYRLNEPGIVDKVLDTVNASGYKFIQVKIRQLQIPEIGDKFVSSTAQKGTIGMVYRQEDMPWTDEGICPDIIINPHAFSSRMTINMFIEMLCGKKGCLSGEFHDGTSFKVDGEQFVKQIGKALEEHGYDKFGWERLRNGMTGEQLDAKIYIGVCYYQRLKHLVREKIHARARGNVQPLTRQPCVGRSHDGGLRFGEMERDCMISHGTASFLKERLFDMSDPFKEPVCDDCGFVTNSTTSCMMCESNNITYVNIPYACKLLLQELQAMCIKIRINK